MAELACPRADADRLMDLCAALCAMGEKRSGTESEARAAEAICDWLRAEGLEPEVLTFDNYIAFPTRTELRLGGAGGQAFPAVGVAFGGATPEGGLELELADGLGGYTAEEVAGKAVLLRGIPTYGLISRALAAGAAAAICVTDGPQRHKMTLSPVWGSPQSEAEIARMPRLPVATVNAGDGDTLANAAGQGARVHLIAEHSEGWREVRLPMVDLPGEEPEFVLLGSHYCTWFDGSTDNITANALLAEVGRLFAQGPKRRFGLRLAWWPGHTHGRYSGSAVYADAMFTELRQNAILYFNVDSVGTREATVLHARNQMAEISGFSAALLDELSGPVDPGERARFERQWKRPEPGIDITRPSRSSDQSFWGVGLPSLQVVSMLPDGHADRHRTISGSGGAWWWHTAQETLDKIGPDILARDTDVHFRMIDRICTAASLPLDLRATARDLDLVVAQYEEAAGERIALAPLRAALERFFEAATSLSDAQAAAGNDAERLALSRIALRMTRCINPVLYMAGSAFGQDPATGTRLLPGLKGLLDLPEPGSDAFRMAHVGLRRQINRTVDALLSAAALMPAQTGPH